MSSTRFESDNQNTPPETAASAGVGEALRRNDLLSAIDELAAAGSCSWDQLREEINRIPGWRAQTEHNSDGSRITVGRDQDGSMLPMVEIEDDLCV